MLAGYSYTPKTLTNHLHLGVWSTSPTGFGVYGEPPYRIGHVQKRLPVFSTMSSLERALNGVPHDHVLKSSGEPIIFKDMRYEVRVDPETFDLLIHLLKRRVFLVDNYHCEDTVSHTSFVKIYFFDDMSYDSNLDPMLQYQIVNLAFVDMNTVGAI